MAQRRFDIALILHPGQVMVELKAALNRFAQTGRYRATLETAIREDSMCCPLDLAGLCHSGSASRKPATCNVRPCTIGFDAAGDSLGQHLRRQQRLGVLAIRAPGSPSD